MSVHQWSPGVSFVGEEASVNTAASRCCLMYKFTTLVLKFLYRGMRFCKYGNENFQRTDESTLTEE